LVDLYGGEFGEEGVIGEVLEVFYGDDFEVAEGRVVGFVDGIFADFV